MDADYILLRLYLGHFEPCQHGETYDLHHKFLLTNIRFLLSRVLVADGFKFKLVADEEVKIFTGLEDSGTPYLVASGIGSEPFSYSLHSNGSVMLAAANYMLNSFLDDDSVCEQEALILEMELEERERLLWSVRAYFLKDVSFSVGLATVSPLDPYLALAVKLGRTINSPSKFFKPYEILSLISSAILFKGLMSGEDKGLDLKDAYFANTAAYTNLTTNPNELVALQEDSQTLSKRRNDMSPAQEESKRVRKALKTERQTRLISAAVELKFLTPEMSTADIVRKLIENYALEHRNRDSYNPKKPCMGLYAEGVAIKILKGFGDAFKSAMEGMADSPRLDEVRELTIQQLMKNF